MLTPLSPPRDYGKLEGMKIPPPAAPRVSPLHHLRKRRLRPHLPAVGRVEPPAAPFHAFIAYADVPAAARAMRTINEVLEAVHKKRPLRPMLWRFNQLVHPKWHDAALADAADANVVVLASTAADTLTPELEAWISGFLAHQRGTRTTLVALFGEEDAWTISIEEPAAEAQRLVA